MILPVPRKNPLSERELDICRRLKNFRLKTGLSRVAFARELQVDTIRLASYEYGRARLKYIVVRDLVYTFKVSPQWLATGQGKLIDVRLLPPPEELKIPDTAVFSWVFDNYLAPGKPWQSYGTESVSLPEKHIRWILRDRIFTEAREWLARVPDERLVEFYSRIMQSAQDLIGSYPRSVEDEIWGRLLEIDRSSTRLAEAMAAPNIRPDGTVVEKQLLTEVTSERKHAGMTEMDRLIVRLKNALGDRKMGLLASQLGVPLPRLSEWFNRRVIPSGEKTLQLLNWVEQEERRKNKGSGRALTRTKPKTHARSSRNEQQSAGPP